MRIPMSKDYEHELSVLRERLLLMAGRVEQMIAHSVRAFVNRDNELARDTIILDRIVNREEIEIDDQCSRILLAWELSPYDLRFVTRALKMVTDLERIADLAVNISERAIDVSTEVVVEHYGDIPVLADHVERMVRDAIDAFVTENADEAHDVIVRDDVADDLYNQIFDDVLEVMKKDPSAIHRGIHAQSVAKFLERVADHATNIAEQVVFLVSGEDIRHAGKLD